jgi:hypothetical protein
MIYLVTEYINEDIVKLYRDILDLLEFLFITFNENKKCKKG